MKSRIIVASLIKDGNKILLGQKPKGKGPYPDTWHIPGGGIDIGNENCRDAMIREIKEETGLKVKSLQEVAWDTDIEPDKHGEPTRYIFLQFTAELAGGKLAPGDDMERFEWVDINDLPKYNLNKPTKTLFGKLGYM